MRRRPVGGTADLGGVELKTGFESSWEARSVPAAGLAMEVVRGERRALRRSFVDGDGGRRRNLGGG